MGQQLDNFPKLMINRHWKHEDKRDYVHDVICEQAAEKTIRVTDWFQDVSAVGGELLSLIGQIIEGSTIENYTFIAVDVPEILVEYRIKVESIEFIGPNDQGQ